MECSKLWDLSDGQRSSILSLNGHHPLETDLGTPWHLTENPNKGQRRGKSAKGSKKGRK